MPEEAAPFSLITYEDVVKKAKLIKYMVKERLMPPWPADPTYSHFANEMVLSDDEIKLIEKWVDSGMPVGDSLKTYTTESVKQYVQLGEPDLIVSVPKINIKGNNKDLFLVMKIPFELPQDTYVRAVEFVPGNKKLVHHVNTHLIQYDEGKKKNLHEGAYYINQDQANSQTIHNQLGLVQDDGSYAPMTPSVSNYLPGALFSFYPKEIGGYKLKKKNAFYLNDMHYGPSPIDAVDSSYYKIYFSATPPSRPVAEFQMGTLGIAHVEPELIIPAGSVKTFRIQTILPEDISLISIVPHMHLIGKSYLAYAIKPSGDTVPLIRIHNWDFRWQYFYQFKKLLHLPRGTKIFVEGVYDNTAANPNNPFHPPQEIRERNGSMRTTDEMFQLIVTYVPYQKGDEQISLENATPR
ncbi:MAG: hypothetical protein LW692_07460 [Sphingobacteriales bacterium]|nr:hypothetical protein [Sphingobacteriales bacterium]